MDLLDLPVEVFHEVLIQMCRSRGIQRAMRLRLVCRAFSVALIPALYESHLLDPFDPLPYTLEWYARDPNDPATRFWHSYLVYRVWREKGPITNQFSEIRKTAKRICQESDSIDMPEAIDALCWLVLENALYPGDNYEDDDGSDMGQGRSPYIGFLAAAARFNLLPLARKLLEEGHDPPREDNGIFTSAFEVAAWWGSQQMLELFQQHVPKFVDSTPHACRRRWCHKTMAQAARGATIRGDLHRVQLALSPGAYKLLDADNAAGSPFNIEESLGASIISAMNICRSIEVHRYLKSLIPGQLYDPIVPMSTHASSGNIDMVRYLIDLDVATHTTFHTTTSRTSSILQVALYTACRKFQEGVVDLILELSANPGYETLLQSELDLGLSEAARAGSLTIVRKLLDFGADPNPPAIQLLPIERAVHAEHAAMIELLLARGATLDGESGKKALRWALRYGLESMVDLLAEHGVSLE
ncbi:ankyrin repeat-containing domain protein [Biscogniauxia mediterranea]|nr:ankyrin repeat-containing domain protein [Biscogniauxia mediterranea]